jgi:transcriptional regulator with XRE-family HTH domain
MTFAEKLKHLREQAGLTQAALSSKSGLSLGVIRDYEQGKKEPALRSAFKLADALGVSVEAFKDGPQADGSSDKAKRGRAADLPPAQEKPARRKAPRPRGG